jgi:hypothetical protein
VDAERGDRRFLAFTMNSRLARWQIEIALSGGSGLANNIPQEVVKNLIVVLPPLDEQASIVVSLNRETAWIDGLVAKKQRLIDLLQEKRAALITRAVTKGLDPSVPMKDSGVEWLGRIPAHWDVKRLWHLTPSDRRIMYRMSRRVFPSSRAAMSHRAVFASNGSTGPLWRLSPAISDRGFVAVTSSSRSGEASVKSRWFLMS